MVAMAHKKKKVSPTMIVGRERELMKYGTLLTAADLREPDSRYMGLCSRKLFAYTVIMKQESLGY